MAHASRSILAIQAAWRPFICNRCRLSIARGRDAVRYQRRGLRTRPNHPPKPATNADVVFDTRTEDGAEAPAIESRQVLNRLTASKEDGHPAAPSSHTTRHTEPENLDQVQIGNEVFDLEDVDEHGPGFEAEGYVPATSWEGLKSFKPSEWDVQAQYKAFKPRVSIREPADVERAIHTSILEIFALRQAGRSIDSIYDDWESVLDHEDLTTRSTKFQPESDGSLTLRFATEEKRKVVMSKLLGDDSDSSHVATGIPAATEELSADKSRGEEFPDGAQDHAALDDSWRDVSLTDPTIKFAVMKRASQLLGLRIHDPDIMKINDAAGLIELFTKKPKPKRLQEQLGNNDRLKGLLNLEMFNKRWTPHHKDIGLGREKLIKQELIARGLAKSAPQRTY